jgi:hypothetical protein
MDEEWLSLEQEDNDEEDFYVFQLVDCDALVLLNGGKLIH